MHVKSLQAICCGDNPIEAHMPGSTFISLSSQTTFLSTSSHEHTTYKYTNIGFKQTHNVHTKTNTDHFLFKSIAHCSVNTNNYKHSLPTTQYASCGYLRWYQCLLWARSASGILSKEYLHTTTQPTEWIAHTTHRINSSQHVHIYAYRKPCEPLSHINRPKFLHYAIIFILSGHWQNWLVGMTSLLHLHAKSELHSPSSYTNSHTTRLLYMQARWTNRCYM